MDGCDLKPNLSHKSFCCSTTSWPRPASSKHSSCSSCSRYSASCNEADKASASCRLPSLPLWSKKTAHVVGLCKHSNLHRLLANRSFCDISKKAFLYSSAMHENDPLVYHCWKLFCFVQFLIWKLITYHSIWNLVSDYWHHWNVTRVTQQNAMPVLHLHINSNNSYTN